MVTVRVSLYHLLHDNSINDGLPEVPFSHISGIRYGNTDEQSDNSLSKNHPSVVLDTTVGLRTLFPEIKNPLFCCSNYK